MSTTPSTAGTAPGSTRNFATGISRNISPISACPVAILQGADDQYGTIRQIEIAKEECYCPVDVTIIPGAGHSPHREAPEATLDAISEFADAFCMRTKARKGGRRNALAAAMPPMSLPASAAASFRCRMGLCPRRDRRGRRRLRHAVRRPSCWCRRGFATTCRRGIRRCATGSRSTTAGYFWEVAGDAGSGVGRGAAGRPRAHPAARLHPDRQRQSALADAEAARGGAAVGRGAASSSMRSAPARRPPPATDLPTVSRPRRSRRCCRPNWRCRSCPRPIGSRSAPIGRI